MHDQKHWQFQSISFTLVSNGHLASQTTFLRQLNDMAMVEVKRIADVPRNILFWLTELKKET